MPDLSETQAEYIHLSDNNIPVVYNEYLPNTCKVLNLAFNHIHSDGLPFEWIPGLETLFLDHNYISDTDGIEWPPALKNICLDSNPLKVFPIGLPNTLQKLNLNKTYIQTIQPLPESLEYLSANSSKVRQIPTSLPERLRILYLSSNFLKLRSLPQDWGKCLKVLNLSNNDIVKIPDNLPETLEILSLRNNCLSEVPPNLPPNLTVLNVAKNYIRRVHIERRQKPIDFVDLTDNELIESMSDYQEKKGYAWARTIEENQNWKLLHHHEAATKIKKAYRVYKLKTRLRSWRKTALLKQEIQQVSMHPCRAGLFEDISQMWGC